MRVRLIIGCGLLAAAAFTGCKQGDGDACQSDRDCDDGLVCTLEATDVGRGYCQNPSDVDEIPPDVDAGEVPLPNEDAGPSSAGDAATRDAATNDAAQEHDAATSSDSGVAVNEDAG